MIRRTSGIGRPESESRGHAVSLPRRASAEERQAARRYVASRATYADDLRLLLETLDLTEEGPDA